MKVGHDCVGTHKFAYKDVPYDPDGWVDAKRYKPADFDIVYVKIHGKKTIPAWMSGNNWDGLNIEPDDKILFWKKKDKVINEEE